MDTNYIIFDVSEIDIIDFNQVKQTSADTIRKSADGQFSFVKWEGEIPSSVQKLISKSRIYNHSEILTILETPEWSNRISGSTI